MIYGSVKNRKIRKFVRGMLTPSKDWINFQFNDKQAKRTGYAMLKWFKSINFYKTRWDYCNKCKNQTGCSLDMYTCRNYQPKNN